ncbi:MAG TPA: hypothetical protein VK582_21575 [Pyrinomonadaceae bacterium]|nr:hypothetical protein [Pyrinomonadaceae bacterium]
MIRRLNYTDRKRIKREDVDIVLYQRNGTPTFEVILRLENYGLPDDAVVFIEAYRRTTSMRFAFGTVSNVKAPNDRNLTEFETPDGILFRVKISSDSPQRGKLLAEADRLSFRTPDSETEERVPLLPVQSADLRSEITKLDFGDKPILLINLHLGNWRDIARSPVFASLVYPSALRQILTRIIRIEKFFDTDDVDDWKSHWLNYAMQLPGVGDVPDEDSEESQLDDWIDDVILAFTKKYGMLERFQTYWKGEHP